MLIDTDVLIIGAGLSGVGFAIRLQQKYPRATFEIYEKAEQSGGTWWANTYPGCACDVPSHLYSYSFALNPEWSAQFAPQAEIDAYCRDVAKKYDIPRHITFRSTVQAATFDEASGTWLVRILDQQTGQVYERRSRILISAVGLLSEPNDCNLPGAEEYKGKLFHSARWDHSFDWAGKDVVVVGNGCSATQFVPILSNTPGSAKQVTQFIRQPHWLEERSNPKYGPTARWTFRNIPFTMRLFRCAIFLYLESYFTTFKRAAGKKTRERRAKSQTAYIKRTAPERYHDVLIPKMELGCKRRVMDTGYLACLHRTNMELVHDDPVKAITATGVRTNSGREIYADAVILATGFKTTQPLFPIEVRGEGGVSLTEHWENSRSHTPQAYYGTAVSHFPNLFILIGPNTATGHTSALFTSECQIEFSLKVVAPILSSLHSAPPSLLPKINPFSLLSSRPKQAPDTVSVTPQAEETESLWIDAASKEYVWTSGCASWYLHPSGRNTGIYPASQVSFWLRSFWGPRRGVFEYRIARSGEKIVEGEKMR
ncbi:flavin-containing monooxygenase [Aspergillus undulatus]|uniref:flavin-containing monooxygenase n=1 Tax=Aspergillus undulatus TaxID=1810928 RepID=UPI003CCD9516